LVGAVRLVVFTLVVAVLAALAAGCGSGDEAVDGQASASANATLGGSTGDGAGTFVPVAIEASGFKRARLEIKTGTTIVWTNADNVQHTVASTDGPGVDAVQTGAFASVPLDNGGTFQYMFDSPGTYYYECTIHADRPVMHAEVIVTE
jgi:plastocyanin